VAFFFIGDDTAFVFYQGESSFPSLCSTCQRLRLRGSFDGRNGKLQRRLKFSPNALASSLVTVFFVMWK
jgi:hypothetical protein